MNKTDDMRQESTSIEAADRDCPRAVQTAEDARAIAVKKEGEIRVANALQDSADAQSQSQAQADNAIQQKDQAQAATAQAESDMAESQAVSERAVSAAQADAAQSRLAHSKHSRTRNKRIPTRRPCARDCPSS